MDDPQLEFTFVKQELEDAYGGKRFNVRVFDVDGTPMGVINNIRKQPMKQPTFGAKIFTWTQDIVNVIASNVRHRYSMGAHVKDDMVCKTCGVNKGLCECVKIHS